MFDLKDMRDALPKHMKMTLTQDMVDSINAVITDEEECRIYSENAITYAKVLSEGKFRIVDYLNAVRYVTFKINGCSNMEAYINTFPERYAEFIKKGHSEKQISSSISAYNKTQLVTRILEQSIVPLRIFNQDKRQQAINVLAQVIGNDNATDKNRIDAANVLLTHLADPQDKAALNITVNQNSGAMSVVSELRDAMNQLAEQSRMRVINGEVSSMEAANLVAVEVKDE